MLLWSNVLADTAQVDLYQHLQKLRPTDTVAQTMEIQQKIIPALLETIIGDINNHLPDGLIQFQTKVDRQTNRCVSYAVLAVNSFGEWTEPLRKAPPGSSQHIYLTDAGDIVSYNIDTEFSTTSYLRFLPNGYDPNAIQKTHEKAITCPDEAAFMRIIDDNSMALGYIFAAMYSLRIPAKTPENAPRPRMNKRPLPLERLLTGHTPPNIKTILSKY